MKKESLSIRIGDKVLTLQDDRQVDERFKKNFIAAAKTKPSSLQEFFETLNEVQKKGAVKVRTIEKNKSDKKTGKRM